MPIISIRGCRQSVKKNSAGRSETTRSTARSFAPQTKNTPMVRSSFHCLTIGVPFQLCWQGGLSQKQRKAKEKPRKHVGRAIGVGTAAHAPAQKNARCCRQGTEEKDRQKISQAGLRRAAAKRPKRMATKGGAPFSGGKARKEKTPAGRFFTERGNAKWHKRLCAEQRPKKGGHKRRRHLFGRRGKGAKNRQGFYRKATQRRRAICLAPCPAGVLPAFSCPLRHSKALPGPTKLAGNTIIAPGRTPGKRG